MTFNFDNFQQKIQRALDHLVGDVATLRTGKASVQLLDPVLVAVYGGNLKLQEVASVEAPDPTLLVVTPWDKTILADVEKSIATANLNLNPVVDGDLIRISIPPLTEERRLEMVKVLQQKIESGRVMLRSIRTDVKKEIEKQKGTEDVSKDDIKRDLKALDEKLKESLEQLDTINENKEKELLTV